MRVAVPPLLQYAFVAWYSVKRAGTTLLLPFIYMKLFDTVVVSLLFSSLKRVETNNFL